MSKSYKDEQKEVKIMDLKNYSTGVQHIGIPTNDIDKTVEFYHKLGFELVNVSKPNKFIIDMKTFKLYNRIAFQKHKLEEILESFNSQLSADENCINNNLRIIWDSGNYVFKKEY